MITAQFDSDDLIYNRFDLLYPSEYKNFYSSDNEIEFCIQYCLRNNFALLNVWGKELPKSVFEKAVEFIFDNHIQIKEIKVIASINNYKNQLVDSTDVKIIVPDTYDELWNRLNKKGRYNIRREREILCKNTKGLKIQKMNDIPLNLVYEYFSWKKQTHGTEYNMSPEQYLDKYHVNNVLWISENDKNIAILFYCRCQDTVYLENFSYNQDYKAFSPGFLVYTYFLESMIMDRVKRVYLGQAGLDYKKRFGSIETKCFRGSIYNEDVFKRINDYFSQNNIKNVAIYGFGKRGQEFIQIRDYFNVKILYIIDKKAEFQNDLIHPLRLMDAPLVDLIIICMDRRNEDVEKLVTSRGDSYLYYKDLLMIGGVGS